jgi:hypothetical protein
MINNSVTTNAQFKDVNCVIEFNYQLTGVNAGKYTPNVKLYDVMEAVPDALYYIHDMSVSGSITEDLFIESIDTDNLCKISLKRKSTGETVSSQKHVISQYYKDKSMQSYFTAKRNCEGLQLSIDGILNQIAETVGVDKIILVITLTVYSVNDDATKRDILQGKS